MPVQYKLGVKKEIAICRDACSLFDVSHMGQLIVTGRDRERWAERICVADVRGQKENSIKYSIIPNNNGGTIDDTMVTKCKDHLYIVINAGCFDKDMAHLLREAKKFEDVQIRDLYAERALVAIQGPTAEEVIVSLVDKPIQQKIKDLPFMSRLITRVAGVDDCIVSRSGYTGEDGFEISIPKEKAVQWAKAVSQARNVGGWSGLGARDTLRLEAGLSLYGNDLEQDITLVEAGLTWTLPKKRRQEGGFIGAERILEQLKNGVDRKRVGLIIKGAPAREHARVYRDGAEVGTVTSGGPSPSISANIALALVGKEHAKLGTELEVEVRGRKQKAVVVKTPFFQHRYKK